MSPSTACQRIVFDVSTICRWEGQATGIFRVEREFAKWARENLRNAVFVFFDPEDQTYRILNKGSLDRLLRREFVVDQRSLPRPQIERRHLLDKMSRRTRRNLMWILQFRRKLLLELERPRIADWPRGMTHYVDRFQRAIMSEKYRRMMLNPDGSRRQLLDVDAILGGRIELSAADTMVFVGSPWSHTNFHAIEELKQRTGMQFVLLCHDIIPIQFPQFLRERDGLDFRDTMHCALPLSDLVVFSTRQVEQDTRTYCDGQGIALKRTAVTAFGADSAVKRGEPADIQKLGLEPGRFIVFVSTVEPRKGHRFLLKVWRRLLEAGIPQRQNFKLVLVGRIGWNVEDVIEDIEREAAKTKSIMQLSNVDDATLAALYDLSAFCVYPSEYEGFGLPLIEAFQHGKAVIASTGGAVPEVVGEFSPCLDTYDEDLWAETMGRWIEDPNARRPFEEAIRTRFRHPTWEEAGAQFFETVRTVSAGPR